MMKTYSLALALALVCATATISFAAATASASAKENIGSGACPTGVNGAAPTVQDMTFLSNGKGQIKITARSYYGSDSPDDAVFTDFRSGIVPSLKRQGDAIVHTPSGVTCGWFKKDVFGSPYVKLSNRCTVTAVERDSKQKDADGFSGDESCEFSYSLEVE